MDLLNKALVLCAEIEQRQAELRAILTQLAECVETKPVEKEEITESSDTTCCVTIEEIPSQEILPDSPSEPEQPDDVAPSPSIDTLPEPMAEKPVATDLRKAFTINDRFRFRRELFGGDDKAFVDAIDRMSQCSDYNEIEAFISTLGWNADNEDVIAFKEIISTFYNGYHL